MFEFKFGRFYFSKRILNPSPLIVYNHVPVYLGCRVHLNSRNGTYVVIYHNENFVRITCNTWAVQKERGQRQSSVQTIHRSDIKCLHGHDKFR